MDKGLEDIMNKAVYYNRHKQDIEDLKAENKRLREALQFLFDECDDIEQHGSSPFWAAWDLAEKALMQLPDVPQRKDAP